MLSRPRCQPDAWLHWKAARHACKGQALDKQLVKPEFGGYCRGDCQAWTRSDVHKACLCICMLLALPETLAADHGPLWSYEQCCGVAASGTAAFGTICIAIQDMINQRWASDWLLCRAAWHKGRWAPSISRECLLHQSLRRHLPLWLGQRTSQVRSYKRLILHLCSSGRDLQAA